MRQQNLDTPRDIFSQAATHLIEKKRELIWSGLKPLKVPSASYSDISLPGHLPNVDYINHFSTSSPATSSPHPHLLNFYANTEPNSLS